MSPGFGRNIDIGSYETLFFSLYFDARVVYATGTCPQKLLAMFLVNPRDMGPALRLQQGAYK